MSIPDNYRFSAKDIEGAYDMLANRYDSATEEQLDAMNTTFVAEEMHRESGRYPTMAEVVIYFWKREDAYWQRLHKRNAPRPGEVIEFDWKALLEKSAAREHDEKSKSKSLDK
jgi:hypothetical protein